MDAMDRIIKAVLSDRAQDLASLLRRSPALATIRFDRELLLEEIPHQFYLGDTPLHLAAAAFRIAAAKTLLQAGADVHAANRRGARPLHYASDLRATDAASQRAADQAEVMALLLAHGADADAPDKAGVRPLHRAVRGRSPGAVRVLIDAGCNVRARAGKVGSTPLHLAVSSTGASGTAGTTHLQAEIAGLLIARGATLADRDARGQSVLDRIRSAPLRRALSDMGLLDNRPSRAR